MANLMLGRQINRYAGGLAIVLSLTSLLTVLSGYFQPPQRDEGTAAHIFQLSIAALVPTILVFCATTEWKRPFRNAGTLAFTTVSLVLAFGALYYLEHYR